MNNLALVAKLERLVDEMEASGDRQMIAGAGVLSSLLGAIAEGTAIQLLEVIVESFTKPQIERLEAVNAVKGGETVQ